MTPVNFSYSTSYPPAPLTISRYKYHGPNHHYPLAWVILKGPLSASHDPTLPFLLQTTLRRHLFLLCLTPISDSHPFLGPQDSQSGPGTHWSQLLLFFLYSWCSSHPTSSKLILKHFGLSLPEDLGLKASLIPRMWMVQFLASFRSQHKHYLESEVKDVSLTVRPSHPCSPFRGTTFSSIDLIAMFFIHSFSICSFPQL